MAEQIGIAAASEVASKVAESVYDFIQRQISYVFKYQSYVYGLKNQFEDLGAARERVKHQVEEAKRQGDEIEKDVEQWLKRVEEFTEGVVKHINDDEDKAKKRCFKGLCPNFFKRYMLSKRAAKAAEDGAALLVKGNFKNVSHRSLLRSTKSIYVNDDYEHFDSRMSNFQEIMEALKDSSVNMIGMHGMGGVGKTTLVKNVAWQAKEDKLFNELVFAEVTETPDVEKIQGEIADQLGLVFREESVSGRADRLRDRLKKEKRILIILDNIWKRIDLKAVGVPFMNDDKESVQQKEDWEGRNNDQIRRCTILLTSRNRDVLCKDMKTKRNISILPLSDIDGWNLFRRIVSNLTEKSDFYPTAVEIVKKCAGLPMAISILANTLKNRNLYAWKDALAQLQRSNPRFIPGMDETLYSTIELSYNFLKNKEAKSLFLLCAFIDAGRGICIGDLLKYSMGLNLFGGVSKLEEGRNRLHTLIDHLKASCLLLDHIINNRVKMHDIVHAVAVSIASTDKFIFIFKMSLD